MTQGIIPRLTGEVEQEIVYHYTSLSAMKDIIKSRSLWGSSILYLNDISERSLLMDQVSNVPNSFTEAEDDIDEEHDELELGEVVEPEDMLDSLPFITSFTTRRDSLAHWGMYCPEANGVAIGFRTSALRRAVVKTNQKRTNVWFGIEPPSLEAVQYVPSGEADAVYAAIASCFESARQEASRADSPYAYGAVLGSLLEKKAALFKHKQFEHEQEFRLVQSSIALNAGAMDFRPVRSTLVPYIVFDIPAQEDAKAPKYASDRYPAWDAIAEIIVGPSSNMKLTVAAVRALVSSQSLRGVQINPSKSTFRAW